MKKIVNVIEVEDEGLVSLLGEQIIVWSLNYIYAGTLAGVNDTCLRLDDAKVVYETGPLTGTMQQSAQALKNPAYVMLHCIEMYTKIGD
jgi:hypothetical protein